MHKKILPVFALLLALSGPLILSSCNCDRCAAKNAARIEAARARAAAEQAQAAAAAQPAAPAVPAAQ